MQLIENKRPTQFLIAEISAIRNFTPHFRTRRQGWFVIPLALSGAEGSAAKPACHLPAARRAGKDLASVLPAPPSPPFGAASTRQASGDRTSTALGKGRTFQVANRQAPRKLEFRLSVLPSATSKFLIDNFKRLLPTFRSHSSITILQHANFLGAPSFAACAKGGVFPIPNRHASEKLEIYITPLLSITSKFLIDNFKRDLAFVPANYPNEGPA
jgi:hypothetical protein